MKHIITLLKQRNIPMETTIHRQPGLGKQEKPEKPLIKRSYKIKGPKPSGNGVVSLEARRKAAVVLEILSGSLNVRQGAEALDMSEVAYYHLEGRALRGLVSACEPVGRGPGPDHEKQLLEKEKECIRLRQDILRYQALARAAQKAVGAGVVRTVDKGAGKPGSGKRKPRRPMARGLRAAMLLRELEGSELQETGTAGAEPGHGAPAGALSGTTEA